MKQSAARYRSAAAMRRRDLLVAPPPRAVVLPRARCPGRAPTSPTAPASPGAHYCGRAHPQAVCRLGWCLHMRMPSRNPRRDPHLLSLCSSLPQMAAPPVTMSPQLLLPVSCDSMDGFPAPWTCKCRPASAVNDRLCSRISCELPPARRGRPRNFPRCSLVRSSRYPLIQCQLRAMQSTRSKTRNRADLASGSHT